MGTNTRYDKLKNRIRRQFTRSKTFEVDLEAGESVTVFNVDDTEAVGNDSFLEHGPYNHVRVTTEQNDADVYTRVNRETSARVADTAGRRSIKLNDETGQRYIGYVRIEAGSGGFTGEVQTATRVDSEELRLLEMSGLLNIE